MCVVWFEKRESERERKSEKREKLFEGGNKKNEKKEGVN